ncbi:hypothetical protein FSP39_009720 [Pinctada imbricata]|uniref:Homeobox domain-containing protein n=1 Tax=Pinctada imbricata TaxID=66713 RepID=A0AA89BTC2_PINIB|nr:hypothetical protein FSP39_009720 [Pinctada imbricata]
MLFLFFCIYIEAEAGLFLSHIRKPKRVRTAFSPAQLLQLEHAFENNHYVVGQERKELASALGLSETQVKVWFQNRRTKYKRVRAEEEMTRNLVVKLERRKAIEKKSRQQTSGHSKEDSKTVDYDAESSTDVEN